MKHVLVVDDQADMQELLRSALELASPHYVVQTVGSAEVALPLLRQKSFDLLITDMRLTGMNGLELARQARAKRPPLPVIMVTAEPLDPKRPEVKAAGLFRLLKKPVDTDKLLAAVEAALPESRGEATRKPGSQVITSSSPVTSPKSKIQNSLATLLEDVGAIQVILATAGGEVIATAGRGEASGEKAAHVPQSGLPLASPVQMEPLMPALAQNLAGSLILSSQLGDAEDSFTLHYQSGRQLDLYSATVGRDYILALLFESNRRRGRIGTVWVFVQRAGRELLKNLSGLADPAGLDAYWETAVQAAGRQPPPREGLLSLDEAQAQGLVKLGPNP